MLEIVVARRSCRTLQEESLRDMARAVPCWMFVETDCLVRVSANGATRIERTVLDLVRRHRRAGGVVRYSVRGVSAAVNTTLQRLGAGSACLASPALEEATAPILVGRRTFVTGYTRPVAMMLITDGKARDKAEMRTRAIRCSILPEPDWVAIDV